MTIQKKMILGSAAFLLTSALSLRATAQPSTPPSPAPPSAPPPAKTEPARQTYQVVYVLTESEDGKFLGSQHAEMLVSTETSTELRRGMSSSTKLQLGSRIPIVVNSPNPSPSKGAEVQYIDVGLNINTDLSRMSDNVVDLHTQLEQSSTEKSSVYGAPLVREAKIDSHVVMTEGKPLVIGKLDLPGSNHHLRIEATVTRLQ